MRQSQSLFEYHTADEIIDVLKKERAVKCENRKFPLTHVLIFKKDDIRYVTYIPAGDVSSSIVTAYVSIRPITLNAKGCQLGGRISGLALMPFACSGIKPAIEKYNGISKDIGDYELFGKIEAIVSLVDDTTINFK